MKTIDRSPRIRFSSLALSALLVSALSFADQRFATKVDTGVRAEMRDGVFLVGDVYRPDEAGEVPNGVLLRQRHPLPTRMREDVLVPRVGVDTDGDGVHHASTTGGAIPTSRRC